MNLATKLILSAFILILNISSLQAQIQFDFENSNLDGWQQSSPGRWGASPIEPINGLISLHHIFDNSSADNDQISYPYENDIDINDTIHWSFKIRHSYNPSSANHWSFFLAADKPASDMVPGRQINGIVVGVNFTGSDDLLKIWKIENGNPVVVLQSDLNWEYSITDSSALIDIERYPDKNWILKVSSNRDPEKFKITGNGLINYFPESKYFGIFYKYSSSQDRKLWIDDIQINATFIVDTIKPCIDSATVSESFIELMFSEPIDPNSINKNNFVLEPSGIIPDSIIKLNDCIIKLLYRQKFSSGDSFMLKVSDIKDLKGNIMKPYAKELLFYIPAAYDILITEIMADPDPSVGLPPYEYIELYNRSEFPININKWVLYVRNYYMGLPEYLIPSKGYLILCSETAKASFEKFGSTLACFDDMFLLTNTGTSIKLTDSSDHLISFLTYNDYWIDDEYKKNGGWSLEMIDPANPCEGKENWLASIDKSGGTPGRQNSVWATNPDNSLPEFINVCVPGEDSIILKFSEPLALFEDSLNFYIDGGIGYPVKLRTPIEDFSSLILTYNKILEPGKNYQIHIEKDTRDCAGNTLTGELIIPVSIPQQPDSFDVVINEILFNSFPSGSEFVELYNRSNKTIDAGSIVITVTDPATGNSKTSFPIGNPGYLMYPKTYIAITDNKAGLEKYYQLKNKNSIIEQPNFPSLSDDQGIINVKNISNKIIDKFEYNSKMHFSLLSDNEGVSLERLQTMQPTQSTTNWHSASQSSGYATPGYVNSQFSDPVNKKENVVSIEPEVFTPDNDGKEDFVVIATNSELVGNTITVKIFSSSGILVKNLVGKQYLGSADSFAWDGTSDDNKLEPPGIYIIFTLLQNESGQTKEYKNVCVLGKR